MRHSNYIQNHLPRLVAWAGALAVLATGADHLEEYSANHFSTVPTIGTLFLLNFLASIVIAAGLLVPLRRLTRPLARRVRMAFAAGGIGLAASSLLGLWISETSGLFGFMDNGMRPAIVAAIVAEAIAILALSAYVVLCQVRSRPPRARLRPVRPAAERR